MKWQNCIRTNILAIRFKTKPFPFHAVRLVLFETHSSPLLVSRVCLAVDEWPWTQNYVFVDDFITGETDITEAYKRSIEAYNLKGVVIWRSGPSSHLNDDGVSIGVGRMKWYSKINEISLLRIWKLRKLLLKNKEERNDSAIIVIPEVLTLRV